MRIVKVDGQGYSSRLLKRKIAGKLDFQVELAKEEENSIQVIDDNTVRRSEEEMQQRNRIIDSLYLPHKIESNPIFVDEAAKHDAKLSAIPPSKLLFLTKRFLASRNGFGADPILLSEDFEFFGPVVGPLNKKAFDETFASVDIQRGFPDFTPEFYGFVVDPLEKNRVWYTVRGRGTNTGPLPPFTSQPTGKEVIIPPQACSVTFGEDGLVKKFTSGYVMDHTAGNTGGLGGLYGMLYAIGKPLPFPEARPWKKSKRYKLFEVTGGGTGESVSRAQAIH
jgi:hypothetical protein